MTISTTLRFSLLALAAAPLALVGCASKSTTSDSGLSADESALMEDNDDTDEAESDLEDGVESTLAGATPTGEDPAPLVDADGAAERARKNAGLFFQPAGCITSTRDRNVVTHVFKDCTGPRGLASFNGTITSTWSLTSSSAQVVHETKGFKINGATFDHKGTVVFTRAGATLTRKRTAVTSGTTASGKAIAHTADYTTNYDASGPSACITRDGTSTTTLGGRSFERTIAGYKRCGIGALGCPTAGKLTLTRKPSGLSYSVTFAAGGKATLTGPAGRSITITLSCKA